MLETIYRRDSFPREADFILSFKDRLRDEFLLYHPDFIDGLFEKGIPVDQITINGASQFATPSAWKTTPIKYQYDTKNVTIDSEVAQFFDAAISLTNYYGDDCCVSGYSIIESNSTINRHIDIENETGEYVRVHLPLIIPDGEVFLEVAGEIVYWNDIFAFNHQIAHSAYNCTPHRRLIFLMDIRRSRLGLPPGQPYNEIRDKLNIPPFVFDMKVGLND